MKSDNIINAITASNIHEKLKQDGARIEWRKPGVPYKKPDPEYLRIKKSALRIAEFQGIGTQKPIMSNGGARKVKPKYAGDDDPRICVQSSIEEGKREPLTKNICYGNFGKREGKILNTPGYFAKYLEAVRNIAGMSGVLEGLMKLYHVRHGSQIWVDKAVSSDLSLTDMDHVGPGDVPFPQESLEFFFEDPNLPTVLVYRGSMNEQLKRLKVEDEVGIGSRQSPLDYDTDSINFWCETATGGGMAFRARAHNWDEMMSANDAGEIEKLKGSVAFDNTEWPQLRDLYKLCIKVLAYASIPHLAPRVVGKKDIPTGRPNCKGRPATKIYRVVYLPEVSRGGGEATGDGQRHEFKGRRGHMRFYSSKRYTNMKGKFQYIPPVLGPNGEMPKTIYKVRKPNVKRTTTQTKG